MRNSDSGNSNSRHGGRDSRGHSNDGYHGRNKQPRFTNNDGHNYRHRHDDEDYTTKKRSRFHDDDLNNPSQHRDDFDFEDREHHNDNHKSYDETVREEYYKPSKFGGRFSHGHRDDEYYEADEHRRNHAERNNEREFESKDQEEHRNRFNRRRGSENHREEERYTRNENESRENRPSRYGGRDFSTKEGREQRGSKSETRKLTHSRQPSTREQRASSGSNHQGQNKRGFASMSKEDVQRIASMGGRAHAKNGTSTRRSKNGGSGRNGDSRSPRR
ncbi:MAG: hypothetical protein K0R26_1895 [Bacteroidota bacterium]|nr:hypothetical protein [Bacteroidota bacterium]